MRKTSLTFFSLSVSLLAGCQAIDAMKNTDTMKSDLATMKATTADMSKTTSDMSATTNEMKAKTAELERKASVKAGMDIVQNPANLREYTPPQADMVAGAKLIAENMTADELIQYLDGRKRELEETAPDDTKRDRSVVGEFSADYVNEFNRHRQVQLMVLQAIAGQIPQAMVERLVQEQASEGRGQYRNSLYAILMLRAMFIDSIFLKNDLLKVNHPTQTIDDVRAIKKHVGSIHFINALPFADRVAYHLEGFLPPVVKASLPVNDPQCTGETKSPDCADHLGEPALYDVTLAADMAKRLWGEFVRRLDKPALKPLRDGSSSFAREIEETRAEAVRNAAGSN